MARADGDNGHVKDYEVYLSDDATTWAAPVAKGSFDSEANAETINFTKPVTARYLKFVALNEQYDRAYATIAELEGIEAKPMILNAKN